MGRQLIHLAELSSRGTEADLEAAHLTEPPFPASLLDAGAQVVGDLEEARTCRGVGAQQRAANTGVLVDARCRVGAAAGAERQFPPLEVAEEVLPLLVGRGPALLRGPQGSATGEEGAVGVDGFFWVDGFSGALGYCNCPNASQERVSAEYGTGLVAGVV